MHLVAIGRGLTLTSEATIGARFPGVVYRPLAGELLPFCAVWSRLNGNPALRRLLSLARDMSARAKKALGPLETSDPVSATPLAQGEHRQAPYPAGASSRSPDPSP
jgi:hypothetical protein